jgi:hypothetical protein
LGEWSSIEALKVSPTKKMRRLCAGWKPCQTDADPPLQQIALERNKQAGVGYCERRATPTKMRRARVTPFHSDSAEGRAARASFFCKNGREEIEEENMLLNKS